LKGFGLRLISLFRGLREKTGLSCRAFVSCL
jgi:hypothetical protein